MVYELEKILRQTLFTEHVWSILQEDALPEDETIDPEYFTYVEGEN